MAQTVTVALVDDLDGSPAGETMQLGFGGAAYEIDLSSKSAGAFRRQLAPFIEHARKAGQGMRPGESPGRQASRQRGSDIGAWAKDPGITVADRRHRHPAPDRAPG